MPTYKLKPGKNHYGYRDAKNDQGEPIVINGVTQQERYKFKAGDTLEMSEERFINANLKDRFTLVSSSSDETEESEPDNTDWSFIKAKKQSEVLDLIQTVQDKETAEKIYAAEESGKNRDKVLEAAKSKYVELGGSTE